MTSDYDEAPGWEEVPTGYVTKDSGETHVSGKKETNPKDAVGTRKVPFSVISAPVIAEIGLGMMEGARKYGRHNWRAVGVRSSVYYDAALRHLMAWWEGEDIDADSGLSHVTKAMSCLHVLRDAQIRGLAVDDRPPGTEGFIKALNDKASDLVDRHRSPLDAVIHLDAPPIEYGEFG